MESSIKKSRLLLGFEPRLSEPPTCQAEPGATNASFSDDLIENILESDETWSTHEYAAVNIHAPNIAPDVP